MSTTSIFDTLAQHDTQLAQHDQMATQAAQPNIFDTLAKNNGEMPPAGQQGPTIGPQGNNANLHPEDVASDPFTKAGLKLTTPFARKAMDAVDKLREVENFTEEGKQQHPVQAFMGHIANRLEGFLFGNEQHLEDAIGSGKQGMLTNPVTSSLIPGRGGVPMLAEGLEQGANVVKEGISSLRGGVKAGEEAPGIIKQALKGKEVAQEPAKAAVRGAVGADENTALLEGHKTVVDSKIQDIAAKEDAAYKKIDDASGADIKGLRDKLSNAERQMKLTAPGSEEAEKWEIARDRINFDIELATQKAAREGVSTDALTEADNLHKSRMAGQEFKKALVRNLSSDGETVNVDGLLKASKNLRTMSKYGDRLEQFLGKEGADSLMKNLEEASKLGNKAMKVQQVAKWLGGIAGIGAVGEGIHLAKQVVQ